MARSPWRGVHFVAEAGQDYYASVSLWGGSPGPYQLTLVPMQRLDEHEPNDDSFSATAIALGQRVEGGLLDGRDRDWYRLDDVPASTLVVRLENRSNGLTPQIAVYNEEKDQIRNRYKTTAGANIKESLEGVAAGTCYVEVSPWSGSGDYTLAVTAE